MTAAHDDGDDDRKGPAWLAAYCGAVVLLIIFARLYSFVRSFVAIGTNERTKDCAAAAMDVVDR